MSWNPCMISSWQSGWRFWRLHGLPYRPRQDENAEPEDRGCRSAAVQQLIGCPLRDRDFRGHFILYWQSGCDIRQPHAVVYAMLRQGSGRSHAAQRTEETTGFL